MLVLAMEFSRGLPRAGQARGRRPASLGYSTPPIRRQRPNNGQREPDLRHQSRAGGPTRLNGIGLQPWEFHARSSSQCID
jgi:hypothetical protein